MVDAAGPLAMECRRAPVVTGNTIVSLEVQDAIHDQWVRRTLARMPLELGCVDRPGLFSRLGFRMVRVAPDGRLVFSGLSLAAPAADVQPAALLALRPTAPAVDGGVTAPVEEGIDFGGGTSPSEMSVASGNAMLVDSLQLPPAALPFVPVDPTTSEQPQEVNFGTVCGSSCDLYH